MSKKKSYGKWIGGGLGWAFGGPIGAILGYAVGSMFDGSKGEKFNFTSGGGYGSKTQDHPYAQTQRGDFSVSLLVLAAAVMKADNKILKSELDYVRVFFTKQFGVENANENIKVLKGILNQNINVFDVCLQIKHYMDYAARLQLLHFLFGISMADGHVDQKEIDIIDQISRHLDLDRSDFLSIKAMFSKNTDAAYQILEVSKDASNDELKKSYRALAVKFHPDKVAHLGEDIKNAAEEKLQKLNVAYDSIKKQRGLK